jgi:Fe2+ transport system protein B
VEENSVDYMSGLCNTNDILLKPTQDLIKKLQKKIDHLTENIADKEMKIVESLMKNSTEMGNLKIDLLKFFENDKEEIRRNFKQQLENIASDAETRIVKKIESEVHQQLSKEHAKQEVHIDHHVKHNLKKFHDEVAGKFIFIFFMLFVITCFIVIASVYVIRRFNLLSRVRYQTDTFRLVDSSL